MYLQLFAVFETVQESADKRGTIFDMSERSRDAGHVALKTTQLQLFHNYYCFR